MQLSPRRIRALLAPIAILLCMTALLSVLTYAVSRYVYRDTFAPGIVVGGVDVSGLTRSQAEDRLQNKQEALLSKEAIVRLGEATSRDLTVSSASLGLRLNTAAALDSAWSHGRGLSVSGAVTFIESALFGASFPLHYTLDSGEVESFARTELAPLLTPPAPSVIERRGSVVSVTASRAGEEVVMAEFETEVRSALADILAGQKPVVVVPLRTVAATPAEAQLQPVAERMNLIMRTQFTLSVGDRNITPTNEEVSRWFAVVQDEGGVVNIAADAAAMGKYLAKQDASLRINTSRATDQLKTSVVSLLASGATPPFARQQLRLEQDPEKPEPEKPSVEPVLDRFAGKYVEVVLAAQQAFAIENGQVVATYRVSTGKWSTPTPRGTFTITGKHPRAYSRRFGLYMPFWQNFMGTDEKGVSLRAGEYGLHELPEWPSGYKEGEAHLGTAVSHGCVRFGVGDAEALYNWTEVGTPVVVR